MQLDHKATKGLGREGAWRQLISFLAAETLFNILPERASRGTNRASDSRSSGWIAANHCTHHSTSRRANSTAAQGALLAFCHMGTSDHYHE